MTPTASASNSLTEGKLDQIGPAVLASVVENCIGGIMKNLVNELVTESLPDVGRGPEQTNGDTTLENCISAGADTRAGGDEKHPAEHGHNPQNTTGRETTDPQLGGGLSMMLAVQSLARETMRENSCLVGSGIMAKACHSLRGEWVIRMAVLVSRRAMIKPY